jgi:hypothetical protein
MKGFTRNLPFNLSGAFASLVAGKRVTLTLPPILNEVGRTPTSAADPLVGHLGLASNCIQSDDGTWASRADLGVPPHV